MVAAEGPVIAVAVQPVAVLVVADPGGAMVDGQAVGVAHYRPDHLAVAHGHRAGVHARCLVVHVVLPVGVRVRLRGDAAVAGQVAR